MTEVAKSGIRYGWIGHVRDFLGGIACGLVPDDVPKGERAVHNILSDRDDLSVSCLECREWINANPRNS